MKRRIGALFALAVVATLPVPSDAQSAADYQAAIREVTERYRGDFVEGVDVIVYSERYDFASRFGGHDTDHYYYRAPLTLDIRFYVLAFDPDSFTLRGKAREEAFDPRF